MTDKMTEANQVAVNATEQHDIVHLDPALQPEHQHRHAHHHHTAFAEAGRDDDIVYSKDANFEKSIVPEPSPLDHGSRSHSSAEKDAEAGETSPAPRPFYKRVLKQWRHAMHAAIWILFTG